MLADDADELVTFGDVRVIESTAPALLCQIGDRRVWLPRRHISGKLWCTGDRGKLLIRRWVARDRQLIGLGVGALPPMPLSLLPRRPLRLRVVRGHQGNAVK